MIGDWIAGHMPWVIAAVLLAIAGVIIGLVVSGAVDISCPKGQSAQFAYFQPVIINGTVTMTPVYTCQPDQP